MGREGELVKEGGEIVMACDVFESPDVYFTVGGIAILPTETVPVLQC